GAGKTIPYMLPSLLPRNKERMTVVVSPLKRLQYDQERRFLEMGIPAKAINGDTWTPKLGEELKKLKFRVIFASPEMCVDHIDVRETLRDMGLKKKILAWIIDEAHCISEWGGEFRPSYGKLCALRTYAPHGTAPILPFSATLSKRPLRDIESNLEIKHDTAFFLNLGNDRPNVKMSVRVMQSTDDYAALDELLRLEDAVYPEDITKALIFVNTRDDAMRIWRYIRTKLTAYLLDSVDFVHALRTNAAQHDAIRRFVNGSVRCLVATESVGMGADIPDIRQVVQFGAPSSLTVWVQRAGRAGRSPELQAEAILLVEQSVFRRQKPRESKAKKGGETKTTQSEDSGKGYKKRIETHLRDLVEATDCRRKVCDEYFDNPPPQADKALRDWRREIYAKDFSPSSFTSEVILPDEIIRSLTYHAHILSLDALREHFSQGQWTFLPRYGQAVLDVLHKVDTQWAQETTAVKDTSATVSHNENAVCMDSEASRACEGEGWLNDEPDIVPMDDSVPQEPGESLYLPGLSNGVANVHLAIPMTPRSARQKPRVRPRPRPRNLASAGQAVVSTAGSSDLHDDPFVIHRAR
ncbi:P-loop containing nucleoside triphosphate hydrolase protein, partial [Pilatotrama ljubarskyi]